MAPAAGVASAVWLTLRVARVRSPSLVLLPITGSSVCQCIWHPEHGVRTVKRAAPPVAASLRAPVRALYLTRSHTRTRCGMFWQCSDLRHCSRASKIPGGTGRSSKMCGIPCDARENGRTALPKRIPFFSMGLDCVPANSSTAGPSRLTRDIRDIRKGQTTAVKRQDARRVLRPINYQIKSEAKMLCIVAVSFQ